MVKPRLRRLIVIICLLLLIPAAFAAKGSRSVFGSISHSSSDLVFDSLATRWDEGMPLGNAVVGELVWRRSGALRLTMGSKPNKRFGSRQLPAKVSFLK